MYATGTCRETGSRQLSHVCCRYVRWGQVCRERGTRVCACVSVCACVHLYLCVCVVHACVCACVWCRAGS